MGLLLPANIQRGMTTMSNFELSLDGNFSRDYLVVNEFMSFLQGLKSRTIVTGIYSSDVQTIEDVEAAFQEQSGANVNLPIGVKVIQYNPISESIDKIYTKLEQGNNLVSFDEEHEHSSFVVYKKNFTVDTADNFELIDFTNVPDFDGVLMLLNLRGARVAVPEALWFNLNLLATDYANNQAARLENAAGSVYTTTFERQSNRFIPSNKIPLASAGGAYFVDGFFFGMGQGRSNVTSSAAGLFQYFPNNVVASGVAGDFGWNFAAYASNTPQKIDRFHWRATTGGLGVAKGSKALIIGFK